MYTTFIRPILEYVSVVWDVCSQYENTCNKLEKVQLFSARIVTGLPIIVSKTSLYFETGWDTLLSGEKCPNLQLYIQDSQ